MLDPTYNMDGTSLSRSPAGLANGYVGGCWHHEPTLYQQSGWSISNALFFVRVWRIWRPSFVLKCNNRRLGGVRRGNECGAMLDFVALWVG
jgi:hypothetical protein